MNLGEHNIQFLTYYKRNIQIFLCKHFQIVLWTIIFEMPIYILVKYICQLDAHHIQCREIHNAYYLTEVPDKSHGKKICFTLISISQIWFSIKHFSIEHTLRKISFCQSCSAVTSSSLDGIMTRGFGNLSKINHAPRLAAVNTKKKT